jgi:hypothetical protein
LYRTTGSSQRLAGAQGVAVGVAAEPGGGVGLSK